MFDESINEKLFLDQLSGIYNKDFFFVMGENLLTIAKRYNRKTSLIYVFIENFDEIVNSDGKDFAEDQIEFFCHSLRSILRKSYFLSRLSHNSFGIHVTETDSFGSIMLIKRIENFFRSSENNPDGKELCFKLNIVHSTAPDEGKTFADLIIKAIEKNEKKRKSLALNAKIMNSSFWELIDSIIEKKYLPHSEINSSYPPLQKTFQFHFSSFFIDQVQKSVLQDIILNKDRNGMLFIGIKNFSNPEIGVHNYHALKNIKTISYIMGLKGKHPLPMPYIIPVYLRDEKISFYRFIFFLCDKYAYGLIGREENKNYFTGFHSSDFYFIEHIISKLQQYYF